VCQKTLVNYFNNKKLFILLFQGNIINKKEYEENKKGGNDLHGMEIFLRTRNFSFLTGKYYFLTEKASIRIPAILACTIKGDHRLWKVGI
jgi:hypothetical protein